MAECHNITEGQRLCGHGLKVNFWKRIKNGSIQIKVYWGIKNNLKNIELYYLFIYCI